MSGGEHDGVKIGGAVINSCKITNMYPDEEIKIRKEVARKSFIKISFMFTNKNLHLHIRMRFMECYVWSLLFYEVEISNLKDQAIKMRLHILKIPWSDKITNDEVPRFIGRERKVLTTIR